MNLFRYTDYKQVVQEMIRQNQRVYGYKSQLAQAAGCQNSFLSQVLNSHVHLTPEHAVGLAEFWNFRPEEKDYFVELVHYGRASTRQLKSYVKGRLDRFKREIEQRKIRHSDVEVPAEWLSVYYSSWHYVAIHVLVSIPAFRTPAAIARRLQIREAQVARYLEQLEGMGLVARAQGEWRITENNVSTPKGSHFAWLLHAQWLQRALIDTFARGPEAIHFSGVYSVNREDLEKLRAMMFQAIEKGGKIASGSKNEEEMVCVNYDFFVV